MSGSELRWADEVDAEVVQQVRTLLGRAAAADGVAAVSEQAVLSLDTVGNARHLLATANGSVIGYANLAPAHGNHPAMAEVAVDPGERARGVGAELVRAALNEGGANTRVWAHGKLEPAKKLADRLDLVVARELWQMRRSLADPELPELDVPADITVRTYAGPADDSELLRVNNAAFDWHPEQGGWSEREIAQRRAESWFDPAGLFLAFDKSEPTQLLGFHWTKVHEEQEPPSGEVYVVGVDPAARGRGLGHVLTLVGLHHLHRLGLAQVLLYTESDNVAAVRTYQRLGFDVSHVDVAYTARAT